MKTEMIDAFIFSISIVSVIAIYMKISLNAYEKKREYSRVGLKLFRKAYAIYTFSRSALADSNVIVLSDGYKIIVNKDSSRLDYISFDIKNQDDDILFSTDEMYCYIGITNFEENHVLVDSLGLSGLSHIYSLFHEKYKNLD